MANPYHHALSSIRKWGGSVDDYLAIHRWFDESKTVMADCRHRALRHHTFGIFECEAKFGSHITNSDGKVIPVRWIGEQHVSEDCGRIPSAQDWLENMRIVPWMNHATKLSVQLSPDGGKKQVEAIELLDRKLLALAAEAEGLGMPELASLLSNKSGEAREHIKVHLSAVSVQQQRTESPAVPSVREDVPADLPV